MSRRSGKKRGTVTWLKNPSSSTISLPTKTRERTGNMVPAKTAPARSRSRKFPSLMPEASAAGRSSPGPAPCRLVRRTQASQAAKAARAPKTPRKMDPRTPPEKACTESKTPLLVRKVPKMVSTKVSALSR